MKKHMKDSLDVVLCSLLRVALGGTQEFQYTLTEAEWQSLFALAKQQTVLGVVFSALSRLPAEARPPRILSIRLSGAVETLRGVNRQMNEEAARYTRLFAEREARSVILKGQANARLYPDPLSRQAGDIDIWVPGGYAAVERLLLDMGLISESNDTFKVSHHISFRNEKGVEIEVHHRPAEVLLRDAEFQRVLLAESENSVLVPEGFCSPSIRFALLMQLEHLYYHFRQEGVGLRHFMDYYVLLTHSTETDREFMRGCIVRFGLRHACAGIMWVLGEVFALPREQMICAPDKGRGKRLYRIVMEGGNFGRGKRNGVNTRGKRPVLKRWLGNRLRALSWFTFDPLNTILGEIQYWKDTLSLMPERIRRRKISL
jgi:hypothetical protein